MMVWQKKKLGELCNIELGKTPYRKDKSFWDKEKKTENVWLSIADLLNTDGAVVSDSKEYITDKAAGISKVVKEGTLLVSFKLTLGRLAFAGRDLFTNEAIASLTIKNEKEIDKYFLYRYLFFFDWDKAAEGDVKVKGKTLNKAKLKEIEVLFPKSIAEQQRIVSTLDQGFAAIDKARAKAEQNLQNAKELFESYLQGIVSNGDQWEKKTLAQIAKTFGRGKSKHRPRNWEGLYGGNYPFIQTGDIRNSKHYITEYSQTYNEVGLAQSKLWPAGTICITIAANIAETGVLTFDSCFPDSVIGIVVNEEVADREFVEYLLQSFKVRIQALGKGSAQANINLGTFENELFPFPAVGEQKEIVEKLNPLFNECERLENVFLRKIGNLEELKKSILQKAFAGELETEKVVAV